MRTIFALFLTIGCAGATPDVIYIERSAATRVRPVSVRVNEPAIPAPNGLVIRFQGDEQHRIIWLSVLTSGVRRVESVSDRSTWPMVYERYEVSPEVMVVRLLARSDFPHREGVMACRRNFSTLYVAYNGEPIEMSEQMTGTNCTLEITLPRRGAFPPPVTSNGNGMWGTRQGPPVPTLDNTLP